MNIEVILLTFWYILDFSITYFLISFLNENLTLKQKSHILGIKSSITMSFVGILFNCIFFTNFIEIESDIVASFGICSIIFFNSYLLCDLFFGYTFYPSRMNILSGYFHHVIYIFVNSIVLYTNNYNVYLINMICEIPTVILNLGMYNNKYRNDNLFGISFFFFRIAYHIYLMYYFREIGYLLFFISAPALILHIYWFTAWFKKYSLR